LDTFTHIVLGACIGEATAGKKLGKKAMFLGALAQSVPDIDFIAYFWLDKTDNLLAHRGITHSIVFAIFATIVLSFASKKLFPKNQLSWKRWFLLFGVNLFAHIFIDTFNAYGTGLFEPFRDDRISFHVLFVADPFFSAWPFFSFVFLIIYNVNHKKRKIAWITGIGLSTIYLLYAIFNKMSVDADVRSNLKDQHISAENYFTTPTPLNSWLWFVVAKDNNGYYVSYRSVFDSKKKLDFLFFPQNDSLLRQSVNKDEVNDLLHFSEDFYTVEKWNDTLVFNVLRFGQVVGWYDPAEKFAFHYLLDSPGANHMLVQRGRFEGWNRRTFISFIRRIKGN
jgi:inner membrane protein